MPKTCPICGTSYPDANVFCLADGTTLRAADPDGDLIGSVIADRYLVTDLLGEGGMGKVYLARHVRLPQQAAIKVLRPEQIRDAAAVARFNREAANASRIDHDRVARVYDFGETTDGTVYLAMEYVAGRTLKQLLTDGGPLPPPRVAALVRQIADGLDAAHRLGIVHRDLKPDNILVIEPGTGAPGDDRVKVVDFGIAKALGTDEGGPGLTKTGFVVGTPEFMSPEQLLGGPIDARSDVYALALVAYQCLTADLPFDVTTPERGLTARLIEPPRRLDAARPTVAWPDAVQAAFDTALARDPEQRPTTAGAFARTLSAAIEHWDAASPRAAVGGASSVVPVAAQSAAAQPPAGPGALDAPALPPPRPVPAHPSRGRGLVVGAGVGAVVLIAAAGFALSRGTPTRPVPGPVAPASVAGTAPPAAVEPTVDAPAPRSPASRAPASSAPALAATPRAGAAPPVTSSAGEVTPVPAATRPTANLATTAPGGAATVPAPPAPAPRTIADGGASARRTLDSITTALDPTTADADAARAATGALRALLPRLTTAGDSTWAYVRLVEANLLAGDQAPACAAVRAAQGTARTAAQREAVRKYDAQLGCP